MYSAKFSLRTLWIALSVLSLIALLHQYRSTEYMGILSKKVAQVITETETPSISVIATKEEEEEEEEEK